MAEITVIGSFVADMVSVVDRFPRDGETIISKSFNVYLGGKGANQCVAAARLGGDVEMIGMLGDDAYGNMFMDLLKAEKVKCDNVYRCPRPTGSASIVTDNRGENRIVLSPSANYALSVKHIAAIKELIKNTKLVVLQLEILPEVTYYIIELCHQLCVPVLLNPAPAAQLGKEVLSKVDYITPNEVELESLTGIVCDCPENTKKAALSLLKTGVKNVIATLGKNGALIASKGGIDVVDAYKVQAVDTVGAGDSFTGALARCIVKGIPLKQAVMFANAVGALTVQKRGAIPSLPSDKQVERFITHSLLSV